MEAAGAATREDGGFSHTAILAREFGIPAVVGVADLLEAVSTGDLVEIDADRGLVRVISEP
ncbi:MAG: PEP-utilizing enzyme [Acidimicrobiia bacterium]